MNFKNLLKELQREHINTLPPKEAISSNDDIQLYNIDLSTREIESPKFLSVETEHRAETIYFLVDRYYDSMDLANTTCIVQYQVENEFYIYPIPFCDVISFNDPKDPKIVLPWNISGLVTQHSGVVTYALKFYVIEGDLDSEDAEMYYCLSTLPAQSTILSSLSLTEALKEEGYNVEENGRIL